MKAISVTGLACVSDDVSGLLVDSSVGLSNDDSNVPEVVQSVLLWSHSDGKFND